MTVKSLEFLHFSSPTNSHYKYTNNAWPPTEAGAPPLELAGEIDDDERAGVTVNPSSFKHLYWQFKLHSVGKCCSSSPPRPAAAAASTLDGVQSLARFYLLETCCCETALFCFFFFFFVIWSPQYGIEWTADGRAESTTNVSHCGSTTRSRKLNESPRNWRIIHTVH